MDKYFQKFPYIYYSNTICLDIARRIRLDDYQSSQGDLNQYYPYELIHHLRPDHVSEYYYKDAEQDWLVYLTNKVIDPYYGWYLRDDQLDSMIIDKYGSIEIAQRTVAYYVNNWYQDKAPITIDHYNNVIDMSWRKYYEPNWGPAQQIINYKRKQLDLNFSTNQILSYVKTSSNGTFSNGEPVNFTAFVGGDLLGTGMLTCANSTHLVIQSVTNDFVANSSTEKTITGFISGAVATSNSYANVIININSEEMVFYDQITMYDLEVENNEQKKNINLIGAGYQGIVSQEISKKLRTNVDKSTNLTVE